MASLLARGHTRPHVHGGSESTMGMMLPDPLVWIMDKLGFDWPDLDEDEIHKAATLVRGFHLDLSATIDAIDRRVSVDMLEASQSAGTLAVADAWNQTRSGHMQQLVDAMDPAATGVDLFADAVLAVKIKVIADVTLTAAQVAAALASAVVTFGAGAGVAAALLLARKAALKVVMDIAIEELMGQVLPMVITPLIEEIPALASAIMDAPVVSGAVTELSNVRVDMVAMQQAADDLETAATDLETVTGQFLSDLEALNFTGA